MYGRVLERADVLLLQVLLRDSRASAAQIAEIIGLPVQAIPGMVARMREAGIIGDMTTKPSLLSLNARSVLVLGRSRLSSLQGLQMAMGRNENVAWMAIATGGMAYVALHLREGADLDREVRRVASEAMMAQPKAMTRELFDHGRGGHAYTEDDMRILRALHRDSNKGMEQVAKGTGVAVRKVRERFDLMARKGALDFSVDFFPDNCDNLLAMLRLEVLDPRGLEEKVGWLMGANAPYVLFFNAFPDAPGTLTSMVIPESMGGLRTVLRSFEESGAFGHVATDLLLGSTIRDTWRDLALRGPEEA